MLIPSHTESHKKKKYLCQLYCLLDGTLYGYLKLGHRKIFNGMEIYSYYVRKRRLNNGRERYISTYVDIDREFVQHHSGFGGGCGGQQKEHVVYTEGKKIKHTSKT